MEVFIQIVIVIASILLTLVVFAQNPKGGGLSSDFGSAHQMGGVKQTNEFIEKATWWLAGIVMVLSIFLTVSMKSPVAQVEQPTQTEQGTDGGQAPVEAPATGG